MSETDDVDRNNDESEAGSDVAAIPRVAATADAAVTDRPAENRHDRLDGAWKYLVEEMFPDFLWFYFPHVARAVDWRAETCSGAGSRDTTLPFTDASTSGAEPSHGVDDATPAWRFLNQELQQIHPEAEIGKRAVDKLVEVRLRGGDTRVLYIHVEVQNQLDRNFAERMFVYHYRIFDRFRRPVTSLAVLGDANPNWREDSFSLEAPGTTVRISWSAVKLLDYHDRQQELEASDNPFAWVTLAHLAAMRTKGRHVHRQKTKRRLMRLALSHGWNHARIIGLFRALGFMMRLPPELDRSLWDEMKPALGGESVELLFSWEEEAMKRGRQEGVQQGMEKGMEKGREAEASLIARQLARRFGPLPDDVARKVRAGSFEELDQWGFRLLDADSLDEVFAE